MISVFWQPYDGTKYHFIGNRFQQILSLVNQLQTLPDV
jgi:hypothetical protein